MAILAECPICHNKETTRNKLCKCGHNLDKAKRSKKMRYWISYHLPVKKVIDKDGVEKMVYPQRREICDRENPYSIEIAKAVHGKRVSQKYEAPSILEKVPDETMTFKELAEWYLDLKTVKKLGTHKRVGQCLANFNNVFGTRIVGSIKPLDLEEYQDQRKEQGRAPSTIDMELTWTKAMVSKAFDNDMVSGRTFKAFRSCKRKLVRGSNARTRKLTFGEYLSLVEHATQHLKNVVVVAFHTGMRLGELRKLKWSHVDLAEGFIRLPMENTKEKKAKSVPINYHVRKVLDSLKPSLRVADSTDLSGKYVFTYRRNPITEREGLKRSFRTACKKAGISCGRKAPNGITFHDIRTTVKTNMLNAGVDKVHRDVILGHSLTGMDVHYMAPSDDDLRRAMDRYTQWIDDQLQINDQSGDQVDKSAVSESVK
jgi:integrase